MTDPMTALDDALRTRYDAIWQGGRDALATRRTHVDPLPIAGGPRWGLSAVLRPPSWSAGLTACAADVAARIGDHGFVYGPRCLHLTLQQFEPHRTAIPHDDAALRRHATALQDFVGRRGAPRLRWRGLTASAGGVLLQGWPAFDIQAWRIDLHRTLREHGVPVTGPEASSTALRATAHATLAIFGRDVERPDDLADYVARHRETVFQTDACDALWLVGYRRTTTAVTLIEYGRFPFGGRAGPPR